MHYRYKHIPKWGSTRLFANPRPVGVWRVTYSRRGGIWPPLTSRRLPKNSNAIRYVSFPNQAKNNFEVIDNVTGQIKVKMFYFSGLMRLPSKIVNPPPPGGGNCAGATDTKLAIPSQATIWRLLMQKRRNSLEFIEILPILWRGLTLTELNT